MQSPGASIRPPAWRGRAALLSGVAALALLVVLALIVALGPGAGPAGPESAARASPPSVPASSTLVPASPSPASAAAASPSAAPGGTATLTPGPSGPASTPEPPVVLVGAGDIARCDGTGDEATARLLTAQPGIVFTLGDNVYPSGTAAQLRDCYAPSWGRVLDRTRFAVVGNHDYLTADAAPFRAYFGSAAVQDGRTWFAADLGAWHVIVLDANCDRVPGGCGPGSPQLRWLRRDLAASDARCTLAMWHQPRFSSGLHGNDTAVAPFWNALYAAGAELVLNGHDHDYERFAPQDPSGHADPARGITEVVAGTGGGNLRPFAVRKPNSVARSHTSYGVVVLTLRADGWRLRFRSTDGSYSDTATGTCH